MTFNIRVFVYSISNKDGGDDNDGDDNFFISEGNIDMNTVVSRYHNVVVTFQSIC